jgi:hypothetical protein
VFILTANLYANNFGAETPDYKKQTRQVRKQMFFAALHNSCCFSLCNFFCLSSLAFALILKNTTSFWFYFSLQHDLISFYRAISQHDGVTHHRRQKPQNTRSVPYLLRQCQMGDVNVGARLMNGSFYAGSLSCCISSLGSLQ